MKDNHIKKINKILNRYLKKFDLAADLDTDFAYYYLSNRITYALVCSARDEAEFKAACENINPSVTADIFLLSIFHEIGHHMTYDDLSDDDILESECDKSSGVREDYYYAPDELAATTWGLSYIETHSTEVKELWDKLLPHIIGFYNDNQIK